MAAWKQAHSADAGDLTAEGLLETLQAAGYSEETAQKAASKRAWERMQMNLKP